MKNIVLLCVLCLTICKSKAEQVQTSINGELASLILNREIIDLTVSGPLDARDIDFIFRQMSKLEYLDLSQANIVSYREDGGGYTYPANEFPQYAFYSSQTSDGKVSLKTVLLPLSITSIGVRAFANCKGLTDIQIPNSVSEIGSRAFVNCSGLKSLNIPSSVKKIGSRAFEECTGLNSISIQCSDAEISDFAFRECYEVLSITVTSKIPLDLNSSKYVFQGLNPKCILYVPRGCTNAYNIAPQWQDFPKIEEK